jgi:hypothetical protein
MKERKEERKNEEEEEGDGGQNEVPCVRLGRGDTRETW